MTKMVRKLGQGLPLDPEVDTPEMHQMYPKHEHDFGTKKKGRGKLRRKKRKKGRFSLDKVG
jgi:hypothetical protein